MSYEHEDLRLILRTHIEKKKGVVVFWKKRQRWADPWLCSQPNLLGELQARGTLCQKAQRLRVWGHIFSPSSWEIESDRLKASLVYRVIIRLARDT